MHGGVEGCHDCRTTPPFTPVKFGPAPVQSSQGGDDYTLSSRLYFKYNWKRTLYRLGQDQERQQLSTRITE